MPKNSRRTPSIRVPLQVNVGRSTTGTPRTVQVARGSVKDSMLRMRNKRKAAGAPLRGFADEKDLAIRRAKDRADIAAAKQPGRPKRLRRR